MLGKGTDYDMKTSICWYLYLHKANGGKVGRTRVNIHDSIIGFINLKIKYWYQSFTSYLLNKDFKIDMANENNILNFVQNFLDTVYRYIHQLSDLPSV